MELSGRSIITVPTKPCAHVGDIHKNTPLFSLLLGTEDLPRNEGLSGSVCVNSVDNHQIAPVRHQPNGNWSTELHHPIYIYISSQADLLP